MIFVSLEHSTILTYGNVELLSMINGEHDELDFDLPVDGEVFARLYYLVEGIYPQLSCFLSSESNPHTKLAFSFAEDQDWTHSSMLSKRICYLHA